MNAMVAAGAALLLATGSAAQEPVVAGSAETILQENKDAIDSAARAVGQPPRLVASVVFAEHSLNERPARALEEDLLARCGYNASLGVAQVKMRTAEWIEAHLGEIMPGPEVARQLAPHGGRGELIDRLMEPRTNLLYASAYLALIARRWADVLQTPARVGILATLYSLGLELPDGSLRAPHPDPQVNRFGEAAQSFYDGPLCPEFSP